MLMLTPCSRHTTGAAGTRARKALPFSWADSSTEIQQSVVLAFTLLAVCPSGRSLKSNEMADKLNKR